jgi:RNA polymerase sigma factor (sigma-70 family)
MRTVPQEDRLSELVLRAQQRDNAAFTALVHAYYGVALGYAHSVLRDFQRAEDATQEAFAEAHAFLPRLEQPSAFAAWLRSIVRHRCLRRIRQRDVLLVAEPARLERLDCGLEPATSDSVERRELLRKALATLPKSEREVMTLFYLDDCSQREVAAFLRLPVTTVNNRLHQARQRLQQWGTNMATISSHSEADPGLNIGTITQVSGALVEVRFPPAAKLDLFDALAVVGTDDLPVERLKVSHRIGDGRALCLVTNESAERLVPGTTALNIGTGQAPSLRAAEPAVAARDVIAAVSAIAPQLAAERASIFETGIKAVDLLCPIAAGASIAQIGVVGVGRIVLLAELRYRASAAAAPLHVFGLVTPSDMGNYRDWPEEGALQDRVGPLYTYWVLAHRGTDPQFEALEAFTSVHYCSPLLAVQGLFPAIDPEHSTSALLAPALAGSEHAALAARARQLLIEAKHRFCSPLALELWACAARGSAAHAAREYQPEIREAEAVRLSRARKLQFFLTQPFFTAEQDTGWKGCSVALRDTLDGCRRIMDGEVDELPEDAFRYIGTLAEARARAASGEFRRFGS